MESAGPVWAQEIDGLDNGNLVKVCDGRCVSWVAWSLVTTSARLSLRMLESAKDISSSRCGTARSVTVDDGRIEPFSCKDDLRR